VAFRYAAFYHKSAKLQWQLNLSLCVKGDKTMATGLEAWLFGYAGTKLADKILELFRDDKFTSDLHSIIDKWSATLPSEASLASSVALFPSHVSDSELGERPSLAHLRTEIKKSIVPKSADWKAALNEQWLHVRGSISNPQEFFTIPEEEANDHLETLANQLADVCAQYEPLFRSTAITLLREILDEIKEPGALKTDLTIQVNSALSKKQKMLLRRLYKFDGLCGIWDAKGEYKSLWVPGFAMDMQWGWERTVEEARLSGKDIGDRKNRLDWIYTVESLVEGRLLQERENEKGLFELTKQGWRVAHYIPDESE
jgi:hypothetical protein